MAAFSDPFRSSGDCADISTEAITTGDIKWDSDNLIDFATIPGVGFCWENQTGKSHQYTAVEGNRKYLSRPKVFTIYFISVTTTSGQSWTVRKRFSEFYSFHKKLRRECPEIIRTLNLKLPKRKFLVSSTAPDVVQFRRRELENYLLVLLQGETKPGRSSSRELLHAFLQGDGLILINKEKRGVYKRNRKTSLELERKVIKETSRFKEIIKGKQKARSLTKIYSMKAYSNQERQKIEIERLLSTETKSLVRCAEQLLTIIPVILKHADSQSGTFKIRHLPGFRAKKKGDIKNITPESCLDMIHLYLEDLSKKVISKSTNSILDLNRKELTEAVYRACEYALIEMHSLQNHILSCSMLCFNNATRDQHFCFKVKKLKGLYDGFGIPPSLFGAPVRSTKDENLDRITWGWNSSIAILNTLDATDKNLASEKIDRLMACVKCIHEGLAIENVKEEAIVGADDFLPVFMYVTANCNLKAPFTCLTYMTKLASESSLETEVKYWLTVFESALHFVSNLDEASLEGDVSQIEAEPEF